MKSNVIWHLFAAVELIEKFHLECVLLVLVVKMVDFYDSEFVLDWLSNSEIAVLASLEGLLNLPLALGCRELCRLWVRSSFSFPKY